MELLKKYIVALTYLHGMVHKNKVLEIFNQQNDVKINSDQVDAFLGNGDEPISGTFVYSYGDYFAHEAVAIFDECDDMLAKKGDKPYYIPDKQELLKYVDSFYFEKSEAYRRLYQYVGDHFFPNHDEKVKLICEQVFDNCQMHFELQFVLNDMVRMGVQFSDEKQLEEVIYLIMRLSNNVRLWENNGFTLRELFEEFEQGQLRRVPRKPIVDGVSNVIDFSSRKRVGRNDPCLCGSGKKYKKCCLDR